mgnify:CR=1 FL=1|jgi:hypothetical protein
MAFWYNVTTGSVESDENKSQGEDLMGPYASEAEAAKALEIAAAKTKAWDEQDAEWDAQGSESSGNSW